MSSFELVERFARPTMWILFGTLLLAFLGMSAIFHYHWTRYGIEPGALKWVRTIYYGVSWLFLLSMGLLALFR